jgi:hypothetical protein
MASDKIDYSAGICLSPKWDLSLVKRQPCIKLLYKYLLYLCRTYERTLISSFEGCRSEVAGSRLIAEAFWLVSLSLLSSFCFARVVNTLFYLSVTAFCRTTSMDTRIADTEHG